MRAIGLADVLVTISDTRPLVRSLELAQISRTLNHPKEQMQTASQLQDRLVAALVRTVGGSQRRWRIALGPVQVRDPSTYPHCNWTVTPSGTAREVAEIEKLLDTFCLDYPHATVD